MSSTPDRFGFGENWSNYLNYIDDDRIKNAEKSLQSMLNMESFNGVRFLDIGSGSGLFSLAARNLGATVYSFDYDKDSVACTDFLKRKFWPDDDNWSVERGDILNSEYLRSLGKFDVVYSWGVLHHTGKMWQALENSLPLVKARGKVFIALYNDQGKYSKWWLRIKRTYNFLPTFARWPLLLLCFIRLWGPTSLRDLFKGKPHETWRNYGRSARSMNPWVDVVDWVGGLPFEVAKPEEIFDFYHMHGYQLLRLKTCGGGHGCNEFVFQDTST